LIPWLPGCGRRRRTTRPT
jgi:hypothetical protein